MPGMSAASAWSHTSTATHWPRTGVDDWSRQGTYGAPVQFACDYVAEGRKAVDDRGEEFVTRLVLYTERQGIQRGDFVAVGAHTALRPADVAGAEEVRAVKRYADTFDGRAEDIEVLT